MSTLWVAWRMLSGLAWLTGVKSPQERLIELQQRRIVLLEQELRLMRMRTEGWCVVEDDTPRVTLPNCIANV